MNEGWITVGGSAKKYAIHEGRFEMRPGITASVGTVVMPVKMTSLLFNKFGVAMVAEPPTNRAITGRRSDNKENSVARQPQKFSLNTGIAQGSGREARGITKANFSEREDKREPTIDAVTLFENEVSLTMKSDTELGSNSRIDPVTIERLRVYDIVPQAPVTLNEVVMCIVYLQDRRIDWMKALNLNDAINVVQGVDTNGLISFQPSSCKNPSAPLADRTPFNLFEVCSLLLTLMGEGAFETGRDDFAAAGVPRVSGSRGTGYRFSRGFHDYFHPDTDEGVGFSGKLSFAPEGIDAIGGHSALELERVLESQGLKIWLTHQSRPLITAAQREPLVPNEKVYIRNIVPRFNGIQNKRSKITVVTGRKIWAQELFSLKEGADFEYVVVLGGEWTPMDEVLDKHGIKKSDMAVLSSMPHDGDGDKFWKFLKRDKNANLARAALASMAFKYIRLKRTGAYGPNRIPLNKLLSLNGLGTMNPPILFGATFEALKERVTIAGVDKSENKTDIKKIDGFAQPMRVVDPVELVIGFNQAMAWPTEQSFTELGKKVKVNSVVKEHAAYVWSWTKSLQILVASEVSNSNGGSENSIPGNTYSFTLVSGQDNTEVDKAQPPYFIHKGYIQPQFIIADYRAADGNLLNRKGVTITQGTNGGSDFIEEEFLGGFRPLTETARSGDLGGASKKNMESLDQHALILIGRFLNSNRFPAAFDIEYARIYNLVGSGGGPNRPRTKGKVSKKKKNTKDSYQYNGYLGSVLWFIGNEGCGTFMRFANDIPFDLATLQGERFAIEAMNNRATSHNVERISQFLSAAVKVSGTDAVSTEVFE